MAKITVIIDGGGTTTDVGVAVDTSCRARTTLPSAKPNGTDLRTDDLCRMIGSFLAGTSSIPADDATSGLHSVIIGMAGVWSDSERYRYQRAVTASWEEYIDRVAPDILVMSDVELVLRAAYGTGPGCVLIAGTGSIALRRDTANTVHRCGGWGPRIDDGGGGFWLGRQACLHVARMLDGRGPDTLLIRPVAAYVRANADDPASVRDGLRRTSIDGVARLGAAVLTYADEGDAVARAIRNEGADLLAELLRTIDPTDGEPITAYGSLWSNASYVEEVTRRLGRPLPILDDLIEAVARTL